MSEFEQDIFEISIVISCALKKALKKKLYFILHILYFEYNSCTLYAQVCGMVYVRVKS